MVKDLREYLALLRSIGGLWEIDDPVELMQIPSLMKEAERKCRCVLFNNISGYGNSLVNNLFGSRRFLAELFGCSVENVAREFAGRLEHPIKPVIISSGPVQEIFLSHDEVDIRKLPFIQHNSKDAGRYITAGMVVAKDPDTGVRNTSFNRMQLKGPDKTGFRMSPGQDLEDYYRRASAEGRRLELAVAIGNHPLDLLAAASGPARDIDELDLAGALRGEPVPLVKCRTVDLEVPAYAEIVLEGYIAPNELEPEGPFGDFMEFYIPETLNHVFHLTAISMRRGAIAQAISAGSKDDVTLLSTPREAQLYELFHGMNADVRGINLALCNNYLTGAVSIRKRNENEPTNIIMAAFGSFRFLKNFIVVDHDVDVYDTKDVFWAMSTRLRAQRGVIVVPNAMGFGRDAHGIHTAKLGIDATAPEDCWDEFERVSVPDWPPNGEDQ